MMKRINFFLLLCTVLAGTVLLFSACSSKHKKGNKLKAENKYPKLKDYKLRLDIISTQGDYNRKDPNPVVRFSLKNIGANQLSIHEWKMHEQENIKVLYAECSTPGEATKIPEDQWKESPRRLLKVNVPRYPLELNPNNAVLVDVPLFFIKKIEKPGRYAIRGELDLDSVAVQSTPIEITLK